MTLRALAVAVVGLVASACAGPTVHCGAGTRLDGEQCVVESTDAGQLPGDAGGLELDAGAGSDGGSPDAGPAVELPVTALIKPSPIRVMQGFAACPSIELGYSDGHSALLILDPDYVIPVADSVKLAATGLTLEWLSAGGLVRTGRLPNCQAAIVGVTAGVGSVSLKISGPDGTQRVVGTAAVEVVQFPASGVSLSSVSLETPSSILWPTYQRPDLAGSSLLSLPLGETRSVRVSFDTTGSGLAGVAVLPVPENLQLTAGNPVVVELSAPQRALGKSGGTTTISATYLAGGQTLGPVQTQVWVSDSQQTVALGFGYPLDDSGLVLANQYRYGDSVPVGQCFELTAQAATSALEPGATRLTTFLRTVTQQATWSALGVGLVQTPGRPNHFCATQAGEAAVRACHGGVCSVLGIVVVVPGVVGVTLQATLPAELQIPPIAGWQTTCADFLLTAQVGNAAPIDISHSPSLRFANTFGASNPNPMYVVYEPATGLPRWNQGKLCFDVQPGTTVPSAIRMFWAGGSTEVSTVVKF